jgi:hypothetical protein
VTETEQLADERRLKLQGIEMQRASESGFFAAAGSNSDTPHHADESDFRDSLPEKPEDLAADGFDISDIERIARTEQTKKVELAALRHIAGVDVRTLPTIAGELGCTVANISKRIIEMKKRLGMRAHLRSDATRARLRERTTAFHKRKAHGDKSVSLQNQAVA